MAQPPPSRQGSWREYTEGMRFFCDGPCTSLFLAVTGCVNALAIAGIADYESDWFTAVALGQLLLAGALLPVGTSHRLVRASALVLVPLVLWIPDYIAGMHPFSGGNYRTSSIAPYVLGSMLGVTALAALASVVIVGVRYAVAGSSRKRVTLRFPLTEIFGWMLIAAVGTLIVQQARITYEGLVWLVRTLPAACCAAWLVCSYYQPFQPAYRRGAVLLAIALACGSILIEGWFSKWEVTFGSYMYICGWIFSLKADKHWFSRRTRRLGLTQTASIQL
jgi:hypothetical protein